MGGPGTTLGPDNDWCTLKTYVPCKMWASRKSISLVPHPSGAQGRREPKKVFSINWKLKSCSFKSCTAHLKPTSNLPKWGKTLCIKSAVVAVVDKHLIIMIIRTYDCISFRLPHLSSNQDHLSQSWLFPSCCFLSPARLWFYYSATFHSLKSCLDGKYRSR